MNTKGIVTAVAAAARRAGTRLLGAPGAGPMHVRDFTSFSFASGVRAAPAAPRAPAAPFAVGPVRGFSSGEAAPGAGGSSPSRTWEAPSDRELDHSSRNIQHDLVKKFLSEGCMSNEEINATALSSVRKEFARHELDCGSSEVQVAALTSKIQYMIKHNLKHKKDHVSKRSLQAMLDRRRKLLRYLRRTDGDRYGDLIFRLGLRDNVTSPQGRGGRAAASN